MRRATISITSVRGAERSEANHRRIAASHRSKLFCSGSKSTTPITVATQYAAMKSQNLPAAPQFSRQRRGLARRPPSHVGTEQASPPFVGALGRRFGRVHVAPVRRCAPGYPGSGPRPCSASQTAAALDGLTPERTEAFSARSASVDSAADTRVEHLDHLGAEPGHGVMAHERRQVLGGLQPPIVLEQHEAVLGEAAVGREEHADVDRAALDGLGGDRTAGVEGQEGLEVQTVRLGEPRQAEVALRDIPEARRVSGRQRGDEGR